MSGKLTLREKRHLCFFNNDLAFLVGLTFPSRLPGRMLSNSLLPQILCGFTIRDSLLGPTLASHLYGSETSPKKDFIEPGEESMKAMKSKQRNTHSLREGRRAS